MNNETNQNKDKEASGFWRWDDVVVKQHHLPKDFRQPRIVTPLLEFLRKMQQQKNPSLLYRHARELPWLIEMVRHLESRVKKVFIDAQDIEMPPNIAKLAETLKQRRYIDEVIENIQFTDEPKFFSYSVSCKIQESDTGGHANAVDGYGTALSQEEALIKAINEALERRMSTCYRSKNLISGKWSGLRRCGAVDPKVFNVFSPAQQSRFAAGQSRDDATFLWGRVRDELKKRNALLPAQLVFWQYRRGDEPLLRELNTNGNAASSSWSQALANAVKELIERDAFLLVWLRRTVPEKFSLSSVIEASGHDLDFQNFLQWSQWYNFDVHLLDITSDIKIPSVCAIVRDASGVGPAIAVGAKSEMTFFKAIKGALLEAFAVYHFLRAQKRLRTMPAVSLEQVKSFFSPDFGQQKRLALWSDMSMYDKIDWLLKGKEKKLPTNEVGGIIDPDKDLETILNIIKEKGFAVFSYKASDAFLEKIGIWIACVNIPQLLPLYLVEAHAPLASPRLGGIAQDQLNPLPHPFP